MAECRRLEDRHADCSGERFRSQRAVHGLGLEMQIFLCIKIGIITEIFHVISLHLFGHAFPHIHLLYKTLFIIYSLKVLFILQKVLFYNTVIEKGGRTRCRNTKRSDT